MEAQVEAFACKLRRRQVTGSRETAIETVILLRQYIAKAKYSTIEQLIDKIKETGRKLVAAQPMELTVGNAVRKVLHHIREEYYTAAAKFMGTTETTYSLTSFVELGRPLRPTQLLGSREAVTRINSMDGDASFGETLKPVLMDAIQEILEELEDVYKHVAGKAKDHIHSDEIILTIGHSKTVEVLLKAAHHTRRFSVIVAESAPSLSGKNLAQALSKAGISTFLVPDSAIFALMSRVSKVLLGAHAVIADGGMFAVTGSLLAATAARAHSTPVVVCAGQFKFTPDWTKYHEYGAMDFANPSQVLGFEEGQLIDKVDVINPSWDYVPPAVIDVYITNDGDHPPSSVYRLMKEAYSDEDFEL